MDPSLQIYRDLFSEWSERTIARYAVAMRRLHLMGYTIDQEMEVVKRATRPNGTIRVARLDEITATMAAMWIARRADEGRGIDITRICGPRDRAVGKVLRGQNGGSA